MTSSVIGSISDDVLRILLPELEQTINKNGADDNRSPERELPSKETPTKEPPSKEPTPKRD